MFLLLSIQPQGYSPTMRTLPLLMLSLLVAGCSQPSPGPRATAPHEDVAFNRLAEEYIAGYLSWRPQTGTALGFHEHDGRVTDYRQASLNAELARLKSVDQRLASLSANRLSRQASYDYRILRSAIQREIFGFEQMQSYSQNPMTYAGALDVNIYIKRDFAPLEDRVRSVIAILNKAPEITSAAKANLAESLPRPQVETAIEEAGGAADFLSKDLVAALKDVKDESLMAAFKAANTKAISEMREYAAYLKEQKLPRANDHYALGREEVPEALGVWRDGPAVPGASPGARPARIAAQTGGLCGHGQAN